MLFHLALSLKLALTGNGRCFPAAAHVDFDLTWRALMAWMGAVYDYNRVGIFERMWVDGKAD